MDLEIYTMFEKNLEMYHFKVQKAKQGSRCLEEGGE